MEEQSPMPLATWNVGARVLCLAMSSDGSRLVAGLGECAIQVWEVPTGAVIVRGFEGHTDRVRSVAFSSDSTRVVSGSDDCTVIIWDAGTGALIAGPLRGHTGSVNSTIFSPNNTLIFSGSMDRTIRIWDLTSRAFKAKVLKGHKEGIFSMACTSAGDRIVSGSRDHTVRIWDVSTGALIGKPLNRHTAEVRSVALSPDDVCIVSGCQDGTTCIWDARTGSLITGPLMTHTGPVRSIAFSSNGRYIVTGSSDQTIRIWDVLDGTSQGGPLRGHVNTITGVAFSPDSTHIFSCSGDFTICMWSTPRAIRLLDIVSSKMSAQEMFNHLLLHGCIDLSSAMDPTQYSSSAISTGGFGDVWRGMLRDGTIVAIKCLRLHLILEGDGKGMKRAMREIYHWSKASHVNVQKLVGIIMFQGQTGMVSAWMENGNLQQYVQNHPEVERYQLCVQVTTGVAYLHSIGMIHGDIKALNVLVSREGIAKINDFDYSILSDSTLRFSETTKVGGGTLRWMAPELFQYQEDQAASPPVARNKQTDVYALGMTMLEIISGRVPYSEYNLEMSIYRAIDRRDHPRRPKELQPEQDPRAEQMWTLLLECWNHDPAARPDASSVLQSLQKFAA